MDADDERFDAKTTVLIENVEHHMERGGGRVVSQGPRRSGPQAAQEIGDRMVEMRTKAPRSPMAPKAMKKAFDAAHA